MVSINKEQHIGVGVGKLALLAVKAMTLWRREMQDDMLSSYGMDHGIIAQAPFNFSLLLQPLSYIGKIFLLPRNPHMIDNTIRTGIGYGPH